MSSYLTLLLVGCGNIGSRHLQAIVKIKNHLKIQIVEPNEGSQKTAKERLKEVFRVVPQKSDIRIEWLTDINQLGDTSDLAIIATLSKGRAALIDQLLQKGHKRFLVEKVVCQSENEYRRLLSSLQKYQAKAWVNCPRRYFPAYEKILKFSADERPIFLNVLAGNLGLGCNAIHYLDLFAALIKDCQNIKLDGSGLFPAIFSNRRDEDLMEFAGTITAKTKEGDFASISFHPLNNAGSVLHISTKKHRFFIDETQAKALMAKDSNAWQWEDFPFQEYNTSELTTKIADSIIKNGCCLLPTIQELHCLHKELFQIFRQHLHRLTGKDFPLCPIT